MELQIKEKARGVHVGLVEEQRLYYQLVKEFQEECKKNEQLLSAIEAL
jgi:hypothetical protein